MSFAPVICVVGGINVDITGTAERALIRGDSNPGRVTLTLGGVGRNIAENLARLGARVSMVTALGDDAHTAWIRRSCASLGIGLDASEVIPGTVTNTYLCINEPEGDLAVAVSDMRSCDAITPAFLAPRLDLLNRADAVVADANLPEESIRWLAEHVRVPMAADPVSVRKSVRLLPALGRLLLLKPNRAEAEALTGIPDPEEAAASLVSAGVANAMVSLGAGGVWYASAAAAGLQPCLTADIVSTNGCGDSFFAAALLALLRGASAAEAALLGQSASALCARSMDAVNPDMTWPAVLAQAGLQAFN